FWIDELKLSQRCRIHVASFVEACVAADDGVVRHDASGKVEVQRVLAYVATVTMKAVFILRHYVVAKDESGRRPAESLRDVARGENRIVLDCKAAPIGDYHELARPAPLLAVDVFE